SMHRPSTRHIGLRSFVVLVPLALCVLVALYIGRPALAFIFVGVMLGVALLVCIGWSVALRDWTTAILVLPGALVLAVFIRGYAAAPLPAPAPFDGALPSASPPSDMSIFSLPTGVNHRTAAFAYRGGSPLDKRESVMTAVLVRHPQGDIL